MIREVTGSIFVQHARHGVFLIIDSEAGRHTIPMSRMQLYWLGLKLMLSTVWP